MVQVSVCGVYKSYRGGRMWENYLDYIYYCYIIAFDEIGPSKLCCHVARITLGTILVVYRKYFGSAGNCYIISQKDEAMVFLVFLHVLFLPLFVLSTHPAKSSRALYVFVALPNMLVLCSALHYSLSLKIELFLIETQCRIARRQAHYISTIGECSNCLCVHCLIKSPGFLQKK